MYAGTFSSLSGVLDSHHIHKLNIYMYYLLIINVDSDYCTESYQNGKSDIDPSLVVFRVIVSLLFFISSRCSLVFLFSSVLVASILVLVLLCCCQPFSKCDPASSTSFSSTSCQLVTGSSCSIIHHSLSYLSNTHSRFFKGID